ncbi:hypothetical protein C1H46_027708 [Malus baccata]|uniref:Uncharacterized protein n=1 Tax=Malus baccata TaxID=106549 RepID=A0A540LJN3_MALBA|nr:hypothetical protein C1H46_027708 [Malus baccata]
MNLLKITGFTMPERRQRGGVVGWQREETGRAMPDRRERMTPGRKNWRREGGDTGPDRLERDGSYGFGLSEREF